MITRLMSCHTRQRLARLRNLDAWHADGIADGMPTGLERADLEVPSRGAAVVLEISSPQLGRRLFLILEIPSWGGGCSSRLKSPAGAAVVLE